MDLTALKAYVAELGNSLLSPPVFNFLHPSIVVTKKNSYPGQLWDWGNWANNIAVRQIATEQGTDKDLFAYEKGSVMNFLNEQRTDGSIDIVIASEPKFDLSKVIPHKNVHKPVLAQHVAFISKYTLDIPWIKEIFPKLERFVGFYEQNAKRCILQSWRCSCSVFPILKRWRQTACPLSKYIPWYKVRQLFCRACWAHCCSKKKSSPFASLG